MSDSTYHSISRLVVRGGFLDGTTIDFAAGLNCLIGGRGAGKTTVLEFLRYGLGLMPDMKTDGQRYKAIDSLLESNLDDGRVAIDVVTRTGMRYTASRGYGQTVQVVNELGTPVPVVLDKDRIFSADVFSQNEIEEIAVNPAAQLELLDRFDEPAITEINADLVQSRAALRKSAEALLRLDEEIDELKIEAANAAVMRERLRGLSVELGPEAEKLTTAHQAQASRARETQLVESALAAIARVDAEVRESSENFLTAVNALVATQVSETNAELITEIRSDLTLASDTVTTALQTIASATREGDSAIRRRRDRLVARHAEQEAEYRTLLEASNEEASRSRDRAALNANLARAEAAQTDLDARTQQRVQMLEQRAATLNRVSELRDRRFEIRRRVAGGLTAEFDALRVTVAQDADVSGYCGMLTEKLRRTGVKPGVTAQSLAEHFLPTELAGALLKRDVQLIAERCEFDPDRARKVVDALESSGGAYEIEELELADRPSIELKDGEKYKEAANLSTGQRCTTILPILLRQSERPLLVDQPEDNLDNAFIYETVVKALRSVRGTRQIIFVTHNPNIPVLGEADRVFVFSSDGHRSRVRRAGSVDDCKLDIEQILEGGREAFLQRKARYGH